MIPPRLPPRGIHKYLVITMVALLLIPIFSTTARPNNGLNQNINPPSREEIRKMDEIIKKLEEEKKNPHVFIPEPNVYVASKGWITDILGNFIKG